MSTTLVIESPTLPVPVVAGTGGAVKVLVNPGPISFPGSVEAAIRDPSGNEVWRDKSDVSSDVATIALDWPLTVGTHTISATCWGMSGLELATATQQFNVLAPPKPT